jgi:hypothetical protein
MTTTDNQPVSEWDAVMKPLSNSRLWAAIRSEALRVIAVDREEMGDFESGISSSDVNHTIFGYAKRVDPGLRHHPDAFAHALLAWMEDGR